MTAPVAIGVSTNMYAISCICSLPITAMSAVAPPGGWSVRVRFINTNDKVTAMAAASDGFALNNSAQLTPTIAEKI